MKLIDLTGQRYGKLEVMSQARSQASGAAWNCRCDCGEGLVVASSNLKKGQRQCRKCSEQENLVDLSGQKFGRWTVIGLVKERLQKPKWACKCDCGNEGIVTAQSLVDGSSTSCGCYRKEQAREAVFKHGMVDHPLYVAWENMRGRCLNPKHIHWNRYGGRGITINPRWDEFQNFHEDMEPSWQEGLTLDRIDANGPYSPENCKWATRKEQSRNQERTIRIEYKGELLPVADVAELLGIKRATLIQRIQRGVTGDELFSPVVRSGKPRRLQSPDTMSGHPLYGSWRAAKNRCDNPRTAGYKQYGGRGIQFHDEWYDFDAFIRDMEPSWQPGLTLDRIDVNGNYEPGNCRWATPIEQAANRRTTKYSVETPEGTMSLSEASKRYGVNRNTLITRIKMGWTDPHQMVKPPMDKSEYLKQYRKKE